MNSSAASSSPCTAPASDMAVMPMNCYRHHQLLAVCNGAILPKGCPLTGLPLKDEFLRNTWTITWTPRWIYVTGILGFFPMVILAILLRKRASITLSLSPRARKQTQKKRAGAIAVLVLGIALFLIAIFTDNAALFMAGVTGIMLTILGVILTVLARPLKVIGHAGGWFLISGCSPRFLNALTPLPTHNQDGTPLPSRILQHG